MSSSALRNRNFLIYLSGATVSLHGVWVYRVALGWLAWQLTHSEFWVGVVAFTQFAPTVIFSPIFGVLADRFDRRAASILINTLSSINMLVLSMLAFKGSIDIHVLVVLSLAQGTLDGAYAPLRMSIVPNLVDERQRHSAIALTSVAHNLSRFVGPALAGLIIALWGVGAAFAINTVSYFSMVAAMATVRLVSAGRADKVDQHPWLDLLEGARYVLTHSTIRSLLLLSVVRCVFGRGSLEMLPAFADSVYAGGASALAVLTSSIGGGAVLTGIALTRGTGWLTPRLIEYGIAVSGVFIIVLGIIDRLAFAIPVVGVLGALLCLGGVGSQILIQTLVDDNVRGRVSSFWGAIVFGGTSLGALLIGSAARVWGLQNAVVAAGVLCIAAIFAAHWRRSSA